ncbi:hypothetical protein [Amycolatopsis sp. NPDC004625]|uniref:hypothetical protein n=1 Tax=Amycolatopsis sp. NPDC004625 TaxID=3154670 RepID=UPI0033B9C8FE
MIGTSAALSAEQDLPRAVQRIRRLTRTLREDLVLAGVHDHRRKYYLGLSRALTRNLSSQLTVAIRHARLEGELEIVGELLAVQSRISQLRADVDVAVDLTGHLTTVGLTRADFDKAAMIVADLDLGPGLSIKTEIARGVALDRERVMTQMALAVNAAVSRARTHADAMEHGLNWSLPTTGARRRSPLFVVPTVVATTAVPSASRAPMSQRLLDLAVRALPVEHRVRYLEEFRGELADLGKRRLRYAIGVVIGALPLRHSLRQTWDD